MTLLADAIQDMKAEIMDGKSVADAANTVAADYGLNAELVERKFSQSYPSLEGLVTFKKGNQQ